MTTLLFTWLFATINSCKKKKTHKKKNSRMPFTSMRCYQSLGWQRDHEGAQNHRNVEEDRYGGRGECVSSSGQVSSPAPSLQLSSTSDESLVLLYLSHSDEVEQTSTFTPADVISVVRLGSTEVGEAGTPAGSFSCPPAEVKKKGLHQLITLFLSLGEKCQMACQRNSVASWEKFLYVLPRLRLIFHHPVL